jgi:hypothetical protein
MKGWIALGALYLALVAGGAATIARRGPSERDWLAARRLPPNHRVSPLDLQAPPEANALGIHLPDPAELHGRFVVMEICEGKAVTRGNVRVTPIVAPRDGHVVFWLPLTDVTPSPVTPEPETFVDVCVSGKNCVRGEVATVRCQAAPPDQKSPDQKSLCAVGLWLPDTKEVKEQLTDKTRVLIAVSSSQRKETH